MIRPRLLTISLTAVALSASLAMADDADRFKDALGQEIIGPRQTHVETRDFVEPRIAKMPQVKTAEEWSKTAEGLRADTLSRVVFRGEAVAWRDAKTRVEWLETLEGGPGYRIKKLRYEALPGLWVPALLYEPTVFRGKAPVVLNVNGHDSKGKAADYKQVRCINQAKRGMIALNVEWFGMGQFRTPGFQHGLINAIDLCGTSGIATHFLAMTRGLDVLLDHEYADPSRVGVTGLSGGGWQTIFISPLDPRVTLTNPVAGYSSFLTRARYASDLGDSEQTPCDLGTVVDYTHLTAMMAPHPTLLTFNARDNCCFAAPHALPPLIEAAAPIFALFGQPGNLVSHVNDDPGTHNYLLDNRQACYQVMSDAWSEGLSVYNPKEIPSDDEVKTSEQLEVDLPANNLDLHTLSLKLSKSLPNHPEISDDPAQIEGRRKALGAIVRPYEANVRAVKVGSEDQDGVSITRWKLSLGTTWTVPAVELSKGKPNGTTIVIADAGRKDTSAAVSALLDQGQRVLAIDLFYFGESELKERPHLWALMVGTVGERPLGLQTGQLTSIARWVQTEHGDAPKIHADGPRTSTIALVAAALEPKAVGGLTLVKPLGSLKELIESSKDYAQAPELFCFGLLESFDLKQIAALVAPRTLRLEDASERARAELGAALAE